MLRFWLETKKVDGFRIDAFKHIYESEDFLDEPESSSNPSQQPAYSDLDHVYTTGHEETYELLRKWRVLFDEISARTNSKKFNHNIP